MCHPYIQYPDSEGARIARPFYIIQKFRPLVMRTKYKIITIIMYNWTSVIILFCMVRQIVKEQLMFSFKKSVTTTPPPIRHNPGYIPVYELTNR